MSVLEINNFSEWSKYYCLLKENLIVTLEEGKMRISEKLRELCLSIQFSDSLVKN